MSESSLAEIQRSDESLRDVEKPSMQNQNKKINPEIAISLFAIGIIASIAIFSVSTFLILKYSNKIFSNIIFANIQKKSVIIYKILLIAASSIPLTLTFSGFVISSIIAIKNRLIQKDNAQITIQEDNPIKRQYRHHCVKIEKACTDGEIDMSYEWGFVERCCKIRNDLIYLEGKEPLLNKEINILFECFERNVDNSFKEQPLKISSQPKLHNPALIIEPAEDLEKKIALFIKRFKIQKLIICGEHGLTDELANILVGNGVKKYSEIFFYHTETSNHQEENGTTAKRPLLIATYYKTIDEALEEELPTDLPTVCLIDKNKTSGEIKHF